MALGRPRQGIPDDNGGMPIDSSTAEDARGEENARTISTYDQYARRYIDRTTHEVPVPIREWLDRTVAGLPRDARILELGSGFGRDAAYLNGLGYRVRCTDATPAFVTELRARGFDTAPLMDAPRFFCYWRAPGLRDVLGAAGFAAVDIRQAAGAGGELDQLQVVAVTSAS